MVLGTLNVLLIVLDLEVNLGIHPGIKIVIGNDLLWLGIHHLLGDIDLNHSVDDWDDPIKTRFGKFFVLAESLN
jgi:hypothetical protein